MLQSWANYLLGGTQESQGPMAEGVNEGSAHTLDKLLGGTVEAEHLDDDWVLIANDHSEDDSLDSELVTVSRVPSVHDLLTRASSSSSLHSNDIDVEVRHRSRLSIQTEKCVLYLFVLYSFFMIFYAGDWLTTIAIHCNISILGIALFLIMEEKKGMEKTAQWIFDLIIFMSIFAFLVLILYDWSLQWTPSKAPQCPNYAMSN